MRRLPRCKQATSWVHCSALSAPLRQPGRPRLAGKGLCGVWGANATQGVVAVTQEQRPAPPGDVDADVARGERPSGARQRRNYLIVRP